MKHCSKSTFDKGHSVWKLVLKCDKSRYFKAREVSDNCKKVCKIIIRLKNVLKLSVLRGLKKLQQF